jgi:hypothetical protein
LPKQVDGDEHHAALDFADVPDFIVKLRASDVTSARTNFPREVCEQALAHTIKDKTEAAYRRGDLLDKRRELMAAWNGFLVYRPSLWPIFANLEQPRLIHRLGHLIMGKSPKADSKNQPLDPPPQDPFEAKATIQKGQVAPIGSYLRYDVRMILNLLANQLDVPNGDESRVEPSKIESAPKDHPTKTDSIERDWDSNTADVLSCIEDGKPAPVG